MTHPIGSGYNIEEYYSPAGGITDHDLRYRCKPRCHPHFPPHQNQYSSHSHYQDDPNFCKCYLHI